MRPRRPRWTGSPFRRRGNQPETLRLQALCQAGDAARDRRDWPEAARLYQEVVAIDPSQSNIIVQLGHAVKELGDYDRAAELYYTALHQKPDDDDLHLQIGHLEKLRSNIAEAIKHYRKSTEINPDNFDAQREYAALSEPGLNFVNGRASLPREISGKAGTGPGRVGRKNAAASRAAGDRARDARLWRDAAAAYRAYLEQAPSDAAIWVQYGHSLKELGDLAGGETAYRKALALYPNDADVHLQLGHILKLQDRRSAAIEAYRRSFQLKPLRSAAIELQRLGETLVDEAEALPAVAREPEIFLDISDFFADALDSSTISGIQRVQLGIISYLLEADRKKDGMGCQVVVWGGDLLWAMPDHLLRPMMAIYAAEDETDRGQRAKMVEEALNRATLVRPIPGDVVVSTGVIYRRPNLLSADARLKRAGARLGAYIHDFIPLTHPEFCDPPLIDSFSPSMADALLQYDFVLTVSEHVGRELRRLLAEAGYPPLPIRVVPEAHGFDAVSDNAEDCWTPPIMALQGREFVLCVGTFSAQKNQALLVQIWRLLLREGIEPPLLALVGRRGQHSSELMSLLSASNRLDDRVHVLEGLTDGELATLYRNCLFTMFPSFVEGWGLPVGESLAYGKLCIASDAASLPEVGGDFVLYIDPYNARGSADLVRRLLDDRAELHRLEQRIRDQFKPRSWHEHGTALIGAIKELGRAGKAAAPARLPMPLRHVVRPFRMSEGGWEYGTELPPYREWAAQALRRLMLESGWLPMESWGTWMDGRRGRLIFTVDQPQPQPVRLVLQFRAAPWARANVLSVRAGCGASASIPVPESVSHRETYPHFLLWLDCLPNADGRIDLRLAVLGEIPEPWWGETRKYCVGLRRVMCLDAASADEPLEPYRLLQPGALAGPSGAAVVPSGSSSLRAAVRRRRALVEGWREPEPWGTWMAGNRARLALMTGADAGETLGVVLKLRTPPGWRSEINVRSACGAQQTRLAAPGSLLDFPLWLDCRAGDNGHIELQIDVARQPVEPSSDLRSPVLGLCGIVYGRRDSTEDRLALAEAALFWEPNAAAAAELRAALDADLRFSVIGHIKGSYSLAAVNRRLALALEEIRPGSVRIEQVEGQPTRDLSQIPINERSAIAELAAREAYEDGPAVEIVQHWPLWVPPHPTDLKLAWVPWEESLVPREMIRVLNDRFDGVLVQTRFVAKALLDSGLRVPVRLMGCAPDLAPYLEIGDRRAAAPRRHGRGETGSFTFLHVSSCFPRKGVDALLAAFAKAFRRGEPVRLVIKGFPNKHNDIARQIAHLRAGDPNLPEIELINRDLPPGQMAQLYSAADAMVLPTRGEGFNMPAAEALAAGLPLIVTGHGGQVDFAGPEVARQVDYRFAPSLSHMQTYGSVWADPDIDDLAAAMRECFASRGHEGSAAKVIAGRIECGRAVARALGNGAAWAARVREIAIDLLLLGPRDKPVAPKVAWVSTWNIRCGIATHSRYLLDRYPDAERDVTVLCDGRTRPTDFVVPGAPPAREAWQLGYPDTADRIANAIDTTGAGAVVIQHQPGLIPGEALARLLRDPRLVGREIVLALHNLLELREHPTWTDVRDALGCVSRVLVHNVRDLTLLKDFGLIENVALFPPGALPSPMPQKPARDLPRSAAPLLGAYGFVLPHKGFGLLIEALAALRAEWPGIRLRMVTAEYPDEISTALLAQYRASALTLGVADRIEWHTDYLTDEDSLSLLNECDLLALPHQGTQEAASGAVRVAMASRAPVLVTPTPIFEDLADAVIRARDSDATALVEGIAAALRDRKLRGDTVEKADEWLAAHDWAAMSERLYGMICGLVANREALRN